MNEQLSEVRRKAQQIIEICNRLENSDQSLIEKYKVNAMIIHDLSKIYIGLRRLDKHITTLEGISHYVRHK